MTIIGVTKGDTKSLDHGSCELPSIFPAYAMSGHGFLKGNIAGTKLNYARDPHIHPEWSLLPLIFTVAHVFPYPPSPTLNPNLTLRVIIYILPPQVPLLLGYLQIIRANFKFPKILNPYHQKTKFT